jgi:hypothetical protein
MSLQAYEDSLLLKDYQEEADHNYSNNNNSDGEYKSSLPLVMSPPPVCSHKDFFPVQL